MSEGSPKENKGEEKFPTIVFHDVHMFVNKKVKRKMRRKMYNLCCFFLLDISSNLSFMVFLLFEGTCIYYVNNDYLPGGNNQK